MGAGLVYFERLTWGCHILARIFFGKFSRISVLQTADQMTADGQAERAARTFAKKRSLELVEPFDRFEKGEWRELSFEANRLALRFLDGYASKSEGTSVLRFLRRRLSAQAAGKYLKGRLLRYVSLKILHYLQLDYLKARGLCANAVIPADRDPLGIGVWMGCDRLNTQMPFPAQTLLSLREKLTLVRNLAGIAKWLLICLKHVRLRSRSCKADVTVPIVWGISDAGDGQDCGKINVGDNIIQRHMEDERLQFLYLFSKRGLNDQVQQKAKDLVARMPDADIQDTSAFGYSLPQFVRDLCPLFIGLFASVLCLAFKREGAVAGRLLALFAMDYCAEYRVISSLDTSVYITRDDYSSAHIVRTELLHRSGARNIAWMHSALVPCKYFAALSNIHCDAYLIASDAYRKLYAPYWEDTRSITPVGHWRVDIIKRNAANRRLRDRFHRKYGSAFTVLALVQGYNPVSFRSEKLRGLYTGLVQCLNLSDNIRIILRQRGATPDDTPELNAAIRSGRITLETNEFNTHELQPFCDVVIAGTASSSGLVETMSIGKPAFGFNIHNWGDTVFEQYSPHLTGGTAEDVLSFVKHIYEKDAASGEIRRAVAQFREDFCALDNGHAIDRICDTIRAACSDRRQQAKLPATTETNLAAVS